MLWKMIFNQKDRWRQVLNEADRLRSENKFLCTLQQAISSAQLEEMKNEKVILVVPEKYIKTYPEKYQNDIWTLKSLLDIFKKLKNNDLKYSIDIPYKTFIILSFLSIQVFPLKHLNLVNSGIIKSNISIHRVFSL